MPYLTRLANDYVNFATSETGIFRLHSLWPNDPIWRQRSGSILAQVMTYCPYGTKPLPEPMLTKHQWGPVMFICRAGVKYTFFQNYKYKYTIFNQTHIQIRSYFYIIQIRCLKGIKYKYVFDPRLVHLRTISQQILEPKITKISFKLLI